jgi:hypothetical protein
MDIGSLFTQFNVEAYTVVEKKWIVDKPTFAK